MNSGTSRRGQPPARQSLRSALRWLSAEGRHDPAAVEEACRRYDLSPLDEEFLLAEVQRMRAAAGTGADPGPRDAGRAKS